MLILDCSSGLSGDMLLGALVSLTGDKPLQDAVSRISLTLNKKIEVKKEKVDSGIRLSFSIEQDFNDINAERFIEVFEECLKNSRLEGEYEKLARKSLEILIDAEREVHSQTNPVLHELGSVDTIVDIVGFFTLAQSLNMQEHRVISTPINLGSGSVEFSHGIYAVPPPATLEIVKKFKIPVIMKYPGERATPTGLAIVAALNPEFTTQLNRPFKILKTGEGFGRLKDKVRNSVRIFIAEEIESYASEEICVIETNLDDITGEQAGFLIDALLRAGALDVQIIQTTTKKSRPAMIVQAICRQENEQGVIETLFSETGTLGVRISRKTMRMVLYREQKTVEINLRGRIYRIRVKLSRDASGRLINAKPEYEDCAVVAKELGLPLREIQRLVLEKL